MKTHGYQGMALLPIGMIVVLTAISLPGRAVAAANMVSRNPELETAVVQHLRQQGFSQESRILVLAAGNRVFLLGVVPHVTDREQAALAAAQVAGVRRVDSMLTADSSAERKSDAQLWQDVQQQLDRLRPGGIEDREVRASNGVVALRGHAETWQDMAKAIQAAFSAGAEYVVSELTVGTQERYVPDRTPLPPPASRLRRRQVDGLDRRRPDEEDRGYDYDAEPDYEFGGVDDEYGPDYGDFEDLGQVSPWEYDFKYERGESRWLEPEEYERRRRRELAESRPSGPTYERSSPDRDDYALRYESERYDRDATGRDPFGHRWVQSASDHRAQQILASRLLTSVEDARDIYVLVQNGQAFLYGRVRSELEKQRATELTRGIEGIDRVTNRLVVAVEGWRDREDAEIENAIENELYWSPFVDADQIDVDVSEGIATLSGTVHSFGGLLAGVASAFEGGARTVRNRLIVTPEPGGGERPVYP